jgi:urea transporter
MISIPDLDSTPARTPWGCLLRGIPRAYAILFFSADARLGWILLGISLLTPSIGLSGLAGVVAAGLIAHFLGFDAARIRNGYLLFNPLLVCLTLGWMNQCYFFAPQVFLIFWLAAVLGGFFTAVAMQHWFGQQWGLSAQSLPAMLFAYVLYFLAFAVAGAATIPVGQAHDWIDLPFLPASGQSFFQTFGAMVFEPRVLPGLLVFLALASISPLSALLASLSFCVGMETLSLLGFHPGQEGMIWCGFNFLLCGIALGTAYFAPSRMSLLLALTGAFLCALVSLALATALRYFQLPASALPYNLVVLVLVYALRQRGSTAGLHPSPAPGMLPESAGRFVVLNSARFPDFHLPALQLPFKDECVVTQGVNGALTHRAPWNWALDFEIAPKGRRHAGTGEKLEDYHTFGRLILAPCAGVVSVVVGHVRDNAPGTNNPEENWGNHIIIYSDAGYFVLLAHLRKGSPLVHVGQRIAWGEPLALCGNSGRSPVPHLHLQVQDTAQVGAPTRPFCLGNYLESRGAGTPQAFRTSGLPGEGARLAFPTPLPALHALFCHWLPGEYRYRVTTSRGERREETILLDFDERGRFRLRSPRYQAQLSAFLSHQVFYAVDFEGPGESILALIAAGLARVPCVADPGIMWEDVVSAVPFHHGPLRRFHEITDPFFGPELLAFDYSMQAGEKGFEVGCRLKTKDLFGRKPFAAVPYRITTTLASRMGIARIEAHLWNDVQITAELIDPAVLPLQPEASAGSHHRSTSAEIHSHE